MVPIIQRSDDSLLVNLCLVIRTPHLDDFPLVNICLVPIILQSDDNMLVLVCSVSTIPPLDPIPLSLPMQYKIVLS